MKIPSSIKIVGRTIRVKINPDLIRKEKAEGQAFPSANRVELAPIGQYNDGSKKKVLKINQEVTLLHELIHIIDEVLVLKLSESKVNSLAEIWHQINCQLYKRKRR